jgi:hypothetical protein
MRWRSNRFFKCDEKFEIEIRDSSKEADFLKAVLLDGRCSMAAVA